MVSLGFPWFPLVSLGFSWFPLVSLGFSWILLFHLFHLCPVTTPRISHTPHTPPTHPLAALYQPCRSASRGNGGGNDDAGRLDGIEIRVGILSQVGGLLGVGQYRQPRVSVSLQPQRRGHWQIQSSHGTSKSCMNGTENTRQLLPDTHHRSPLLTHCSPLLTTVHHYSPMFTITHHCSPLLTITHHCSPLPQPFNHYHSFALPPFARSLFMTPPSPLHCHRRWTC